MDTGKFFIKILALLLVTSSLVYAGPGKDLRIAAKKGDIDTVKLLLAQGVNVDATNKKGGTALIKAAKEGHINIVQLLLSHGANPNLRNWYANSAIDVADNNGHDEISDIMMYGCREQVVTFMYRDITPEKFKEIMKRAFLSRRYTIESSDSNSVTAAYGRSERLYKVKGSIDGNRVILQFIKGYGARKTNYLLNLKKNMVIMF